MICTQDRVAPLIGANARNLFYRRVLARWGQDRQLPQLVETDWIFLDIVDVTNLDGCLRTIGFKISSRCLHAPRVRLADCPQYRADGELAVEHGHRIRDHLNLGTAARQVDRDAVLVDVEHLFEPKFQVVSNHLQGSEVAAAHDDSLRRRTLPE